MMPNHNKMGRILIIVIILLIAALIYMRISNQRNQKPIFSGVAEATNYDLGFDIPGTIEHIYVKEGESIKKGTLLADLNSETQTAQANLSYARHAEAEANLADLKAGARPQEIKEAEGQYLQAQSQLEKAVNGPTVQELNQAKATMESARQNYENINLGNRSEDIAAAKNQVDSARSNLDTTKRDYERSRNLYNSGAIAAQQTSTTTGTNTGLPSMPTRQPSRTTIN